MNPNDVKMDENYNKIELIQNEQAIKNLRCAVTVNATVVWKSNNDIILIYSFIYHSIQLYS